MKYGLHLSIAGKRGIAGAAEEAELLGLSALQIFAKSPRSWKTRPLRPGEVEGFRARQENLGGLPTVIHASYLVNLAAEGELGERSVFSLADDLAKAQALGASYVVVHPGSGELTRARSNALRALSFAGLEPHRRGPRLLIENTAGGGEKLGALMEELAELVADTPFGVCLDTCHAFAAGYDPLRALDELERYVGLERLGVVHLNDSVGDRGSHVDHHANLLEGKMGSKLKEVFLKPRLREKIFILETPRSPQEDAHNLRVLRGWLRGE
ncbi:MAG: deoxyribonuclease IV [Meiothermus sp.]|uniref:deoxyribonuclease IV n=1 Tax=Meiothermus sp. TaxID=1955249 RepID=UPI00298F1941|nr:deoxyribonuclease IV [Meiothermus sp.]MDW8481224.1 deoxyribonuclease IV [Meiothermus sp.]